MGQKRPVLSVIELHDIYNDTIQNICGQAVPNLKAEELVERFPCVFYIDKTTLGERKLCMVRIDGEPFSMEATDNGISGYVPAIFRIRLFGGRRRRPTAQK